MSNSIAIVGAACCYPDARSPQELWENVLAQRRAFRRIPPERLRLADYWSADRNAPDCIYSSEAALIDHYEFDRSHFRIAGNTFRSTDTAHWLALDVASQALNDAGFTDGHGLGRENTGVFLGNTLTGEFSRANTLRLRWPYVRRVVDAALAKEEWSPQRRERFSQQLEAAYKNPFPPIGEESLAGGLSNTIAGRICNHFNFKGGGYSVDGACASSLLAVANACSALIAGDVDAALTGGVDLSLDPFELVGFAKTGALAADMMRIYDKQSNGFWPGEGCGFVLLMREGDALKQGLRIYALIRGWGISSDGSGGITRPEIGGQLLALERAYRRAGFGIESVAYFEGHGTGTAVGDAVELQALSRARQERGKRGFPAAIGSVKANIGHTKAAAGVAGLIKTICALDSGTIPPTTGCEDPHPEFSNATCSLRTLKKAEPWPAGEPFRAGISSMGFGGINAHVVLEAGQSNARAISSVPQSLASAAQDCELFLLASRDRRELLAQVNRISTFAARLSLAELSDLAAQLEANLEHGIFRAAIVASSPSGLAEGLTKLKKAITGKQAHLDITSGVFFSSRTEQPHIGFLFPGQGSPSNVEGGILRRRFPVVDDIYSKAQLDKVENETATEIAQPAIATASLGALRVLASLGMTAEIAVGHSLGELTALSWAGALDEGSLLRIARARGHAMMQSNGVAGGMASIGAGADEVRALLNGEGVCIAGLNSPFQTVISGEIKALNGVIRRARSQNLSAVQLRVSHAFHSPLVAAAGPTLAACLATEQFQPLKRKVISTITGRSLLSDADLRKLLDQQLTSPVRFMEAVTAPEAEEIDLWLEVGPGEVLGGIMNDITETSVISIDAGGDSLNGLLNAIAATFVLGQPVNQRALFDGRFTRPFNLDWNPQFFVNPCELAPVHDIAEDSSNEETQPLKETEPNFESISTSLNASPLALLTQLIAERAELSLTAITPESRFLSDLHLNSIKVSQLVGDVASRLHLPRPVSATDFADATIAEAARALEEQQRLGPTNRGYQVDLLPAGIDSWVRPFVVDLVERPLGEFVPTNLLGKPATSDSARGWQVMASTDHPLADSIRRNLTRQPGNGVVVCLPADPNEEVVGQLLEAAHLALDEKGTSKFVLVQDRKGAAAFARTLHLEASRVTTCVVSVPHAHPQAADWVTAEAVAAEGYVEAHYDHEGRRCESLVRPLSNSAELGPLPLSPADVLLVSGGGKGITAECALALAKESGARLALIGRADAEKDAELSSNLKRFEASGVEFRYVAADVTDRDGVVAAVKNLQAQLGPITGVLHGAARNEPKLLVNLDEDSFRQTLAVKVQGARNLLGAIDAEKLKLLVTFSSIIARTGLPGEADYGVANEWLTQLTEDWKAEHPSCRCLAVEWSIWSGKGMGGRLGDTDRLMQQGVTPISPDDGISMLRKLLGQPNAPVSVVVMSRFSDLPTFTIDRPELPFLRFLEQPRVYYPGIELVVDADLSTVTDPYLDDHVFQGDRILPAVIGLEAMAQAASALLGSSQAILFENLSFNKPVIVPEVGSLKIRLAALARDDRTVTVSLRSEETGFHMDHFQATCRFKEEPARAKLQSTVPTDFCEQVSLHPERDLYGSLLFQSGRFRRIRNYRLLTAKECVAEIASGETTSWFSQYLPGKLVLGDPGARDAALHAIQACIPHKAILPVAVDRLTLMGVSRTGPLFVHARERSCDGDLFVYDVAVTDANGRLFERWDGLQLKAVSQRAVDGPWSEALLGPYIGRRVEELIPGADISVALLRDDQAERRERSNGAIQMALGKDVQVFRRPDGKPEVNGDRFISASHSRELALGVGGRKPLSCDIEHVVTRSDSEWTALLGPDRFELARFVAGRAHEDTSASATRVWTVDECLKKVGAATSTPLTFVSANKEGWVVLSAGCRAVASYAAQIHDQEAPCILTLAA